MRDAICRSRHRFEQQSFYNVSYVTIGGGDGSSFEKAVIVHAHKLETAILAAYKYIALRYRLAQFSQWHLSSRKSAVLTLGRPLAHHFFA